MFVTFSTEGHTATITFNRPKALNALNRQTLNELSDIIGQIAADQTIYTVILTGAGKAFVAGADIAEMQDLDAAEGRAFAELGQRIFSSLESLDKVTIAAINGYALGGGMELALACDLRYVAPSAKMGQPEVTLGITPGFAGTQRLPKLINKALAKEYILTGRMISADEAKSVGLVNDIAEDVVAKAQAVAEQIANNAPIAVRYAKRLITMADDLSIQNGNEMEAALFGLCFATEDQRAGMQGFLNKKRVAFNNK